MSMTTERHLTPGYLDQALRADVTRGLTATPKQLPPKWFYDARGSELFEEITRLPEYYPTRRERGSSPTPPPRSPSVSGADTLVELGSGSSEKTRLLLDAMRARRHAAALRPRRRERLGPAATASRVAGRRLPGPRGPRRRRRLRAAPGPTARGWPPHGRLPRRHHRQPRPGHAGPFPAASCSDGLAAGDTLLLGTDLVKAARPARARRTTTPQGVTAAFNKNVLAVINRELGADFDLDAFDHVAVLGPRERVDRDAAALRPGPRP